jgi:hypothetical protein
MFLTVAADHGNQALKAQHSARAWGNAPGWYSKGKPASAESAIQLLDRLFQPWGYSENRS